MSAESLTYIVDRDLANTLIWLIQHQDCYDSFEYNSQTKLLTVFHANGVDVIYEGDYLNATYGILITAHNFVKSK